MSTETNSEKYCLTIDLAKLATRLSAETGKRHQDASARLWLTRHGFRYLGSHYCEGAAKGLLKPDEILSTRQRRIVHGSVFWE
jgi:hypothetical protein